MSNSKKVNFVKSSRSFRLWEKSKSFEIKSSLRSFSSQPIIDHYRAKDDLSCGYSFDGSPTVGFYINPRNAKRKKSKVFPWWKIKTANFFLSKEFSRSVCVKPLGLRSMKEKHIELVKVKRIEHKNNSRIWRKKFSPISISINFSNNIGWRQQKTLLSWGTINIGVR